MQSFPSSFVLRHKKENLKKCSLRGLEIREDFRFFSYPCAGFPDFSSHLLLTLDAPELSISDAWSGILIIDGTWRYAELMQRQVEKAFPKIERRSLPSILKTAYPRRQDSCLDPARGLASIEAIFAAYHILGRSVEGLLDGYYWREEFLEKNKFLNDEKQTAL